MILHFADVAGRTRLGSSEGFSLSRSPSSGHNSPQKRQLRLKTQHVAIASHHDENNVSPFSDGNYSDEDEEWTNLQSALEGTRLELNRKLSSISVPDSQFS